MATSNITNTILDPSSDPVEGVKVVATLMPGPGFREDTLTEVARSCETESDANGAWSLALERNTNITPDGTYYKIDEFIPKARGGQTTYIIQVGASNQTVSAAMVNPNPTLATATYLTQEAGDARYTQLAITSDTPDAITLGQSGSAGAGAAAARSDHAHAFPSEASLKTEMDLDRLGWHMTRVATQTLTADTPANISWDTEIQDTPGNFTPHATTGTTFTVPTGGGGLWAISVYGELHAGAAEGWYIKITAGGMVVATEDKDDIESGIYLTLTTILPLSAAQTIVVSAESRDSRNFTGRFTAYRIGN